MAVAPPLPPAAPRAAGRAAPARRRQPLVRARRRRRATGCSLEVLVDGAEVLPAIAEAIRGARRSVRMAGWHGVAALRARARRAAHRAARAAGRRGRAAASTSASCCGPARRCTPSRPSRAAVRAVARELAPRHRRPRRTSTRASASCTATTRSSSWSTTRSPSSAASTSPTSAATAGTRAGIPPAGAWAGTTPARGCAARSSPTSPSTSTCAGRRSPARRCRAVPVPAPAGDTTVQLLRTIPEKRLRPACRGGAFGILEGYLRALRRRARARLPRVPVLLAAGDRRPAGREAARPAAPSASASSSCCPRRPNNGEDDTRGMLAQLADADPERRRHLATTIDATHRHDGRPALRARQDRHRRRPLADDRLGEPQRALVLQRHGGQRRRADPALARATRLRLWAEHLELPVEEVAGDPADVVDRLWRPIARRERERRAARRARASTGCASCTPGSRRLERLLGPMDAVVVDG